MDALRTDSDTEQFIIAALRSAISVSSLSLKMSKLYSPESLLSIAAFQQNSLSTTPAFMQNRAIHAKFLDIIWLMKYAFYRFLYFAKKSLHIIK